MWVATARARCVDLTSVCDEKSQPTVRDELTSLFGANSSRAPANAGRAPISRA